MQPFPLQKTVADAYLDVATHLGAFVRAGGVWILIPVLLTAATRVLFEMTAEPIEPGRPVMLPWPLFLLVIVANVLWLLGMSALVVFWHRRLLLGVGTPTALAPLSWNVVRYMAASFFLGLSIAIIVQLIAFVLGTLIAGPGGGAASFGAPVLRLLVGVLGGLLLARIHLLFPAIAVGDTAMSLGRSFKLTEGYTLPIFLGIIACAVPMMLLGSIVQAALVAVGGAGSLSGFAISTALDFVQGAVIAAFLSLSYRFFTTVVAHRRPGLAP
jgi:hypothetical protein